MTLTQVGPRVHDARLMGVRPDANLDVLLAVLSPRQRPGEYVFVVDTARSVQDQAVLASVVEPEGRSIVVTRQDADHAGLSYDFVVGWITLEVRSALDAVGLSAAVADALSQAGISCNVVAGYHHDHLFVPHERVDDALEVLEQLSVRHRSALAATPTVRPAGIGDAAAITELARSAYAPYVARLGRVPTPMTDDYGRAIGHDEVWVAEREERLVGLLVLRLREDHLLLENVAVAPNAQRLGIGKRLLDLAEERARTAGLREVRLYTNVAMTENLAYYPGHGYRETHRAIQGGFQRVFFTKSLTES